MDTTVLTILGAAFGVMFATMTTLMFVSIRVQHRDSTQIRTEMHALIERSSRESRDHIERSVDKLSAEFAEHKGITDANHRAVQEQFGDVRYRLGRIEGHLGIGMPLQPDDEPDGPQPN